MKRWMCILLITILFIGFAVPVWADDGDAIFPGSEILVGSGEEWDGDLAVLGGSLELREGGRIRGDVVVLTGRAVIDGRIDGDLVVLGGSLDLRSDAVIRGDLVTFFGSVSRSEGATVHGQVIDGFRGRGVVWPDWDWTPTMPRIDRAWPWSSNVLSGWFGGLMRKVLNTFALMALGVLLALLLPKQTKLVAQTAGDAPLPSIGFGLLTFLVLLILIPLLVIICIGIPVALLLALAAIAAGIFGWIAIGVLIGDRLLTALNVKQAQPVLEVIAGLAVLALLSSVWCLGGLLGLIVGSAGLGAVVLSRGGTTPYAPLSAAETLPEPLEADAEPVPDEPAED